MNEEGGGNVRIAILNPLPGLLAHFNRALIDNLEMIDGVTVVELDVTGTEMDDDSGTLDRVRSAIRFVREVRRETRRADFDCVINIWPTFGYIDALLWRILPLQPRVWTILHDVKPLRPQFGYWPPAIRPLRLGTLGSHGWLVHTQHAADTAVALGFDRPVVVPHPILTEHERASQPSREVLVFGQHKPARDTELLVRLGPSLREAGFVPHIVGRGWPRLENWEYDERFVNEADVPKVLREAAAVLIPYKRYYQSGVAIRAIESGTPVVGVRTKFLEDYLGRDWPGLIEPESDCSSAWIEAIVRAIAVPPGDLAALVERSRCGVVNRWSQALRSEIRAHHND